MADKSKKIGGISQYKTFGSGKNKTSEPLHVQMSEAEDEQERLPQDASTSSEEDTSTIEREDEFTSLPSNVPTVPRHEETTSSHTDTPVPSPQDEQSLSGSRPTTLNTRETQGSLTREQKDVQSFSSVGTQQTPMLNQLQQYEQLLHSWQMQTPAPANVQEREREDEKTMEKKDVQTFSRQIRNPEKEAGRQTVYFDPPELRQELRALVFLENRDISAVVSDAVRLYIEQSPQRAMIPVVLAAQQKKTKK